MGELTAIHISEIYNRDSILKNGLFPSEVLLPHHLERFREDGYLEEDESKMLYMWCDSEKNEKFIKDMMYCKTWITPRNKTSIEYDKIYNEKDYLDCSTLDMSKLYPYTNMIYDIYKVTNFNAVEDSLKLFHEQESSGDKYSTLYNMDGRYQHKDKILILSKQKEQTIKRIGQAKMWITKKDRIQTQIFKSIRY